MLIQIFVILCKDHVLRMSVYKNKNKVIATLILLHFCPKLAMNTDLGIFSLGVCKNYMPNNNVLIQLESLSFS